MAQLVEWSLPSIEIRVSNSVIGKAKNKSRLCHLTKVNKIAMCSEECQ